MDQRLSPELGLFGEFLWGDLAGWGAMDDEAAVPLGAGDEDGADAAFGRNALLDAVDVGFLPGEADAGAGIDAPLEHLKSVVLEPFAKVAGGLALGFGADREVESNDQPTHFEFFGVHGL